MAIFNRELLVYLQISVGDYIPNSLVMFNWDIYQPQVHHNYSWLMHSHSNKHQVLRRAVSELEAPNPMIVGSCEAHWLTTANSLNDNFYA